MLLSFHFFFFFFFFFALSAIEFFMKYVLRTFAPIATVHL